MAANRRQQRELAKADSKAVQEMLEREQAQDLMSRAEKLKPDDVWWQYVYFCDRMPIQAMKGVPRNVSSSTSRAYKQDIKALLTTLRDGLKIRPKNLTEISAKLVVRCILFWEKEGKSASVLQNRYSHLLRFLHWMGKGLQLGSLDTILKNPENGKRHYSATVPKDFESNNVDVMAKIKEAEGHCKVAALQMKLQYFFGLRARESLMLKPHQSDLGTWLVLDRGTKGGKTRTVPILTAEQREVLDQAKKMANTRTGLLGRYGHKYMPASNHYYYVMKKVGLTRKEMGVTSHGLRHSYANNRYETLAGEPSPVRGGIKVDPEIDRAARSKLTRELGHERIQITPAYTGSVRHLSRLARTNIEKLFAEVEQKAVIDCVDTIRAKLATTGQLVSFYVYGDAADGKPGTDKQPLPLGVHVHSGPGIPPIDPEKQRALTSEAIHALTPTLINAIGRSVQPIDHCWVDASKSRIDLF